MKKFTTSNNFLAAFAVFVVSVVCCHGQPFRAIGQWDYKAGGFASTNVIVETNGIAQTNAVMRWTSRQGVALEFLQEDWLEGADALTNTGGPEGYGLWPGAETVSNQTVIAGIMAVKPEELRVRSALLTGMGESVVRLSNRPGGGEFGHWDRVGPAEGVQIFVNGVPDAKLQAGVWQVVTFILPAEAPLYNMMVAGDPGLPTAGRRTFQGEVRHVTLLGRVGVSTGGVGTSIGGVETAELEPALRAMERVLAVRYQIPGIRTSKNFERSAAKATRWHDYGQFPTLLMIK